MENAKSGVSNTRDSPYIFCNPLVARNTPPLKPTSSPKTIAVESVFIAIRIASLTAVKLDADLKAYYERKVAEGKNKMSVLNAVKNKLLARVIAVVNKQELYVKKAA